ncbi:MAG: hypothetical protein A2079_04655 [Geobacteraceae bacterium GWC2_48_7]|nr:MAG: hypothetical protein A2079_04655 [Geobacteraceae bacterium GWC2_48_7]
MLYKVGIIPILAGIFSIFVITVHFTTFHTTALHVDSADQSYAIAGNSKVKKILPIVIAIITSIFLSTIPSPVRSVFIPEWPPVFYFQNFPLSPRAPP